MTINKKINKCESKKFFFVRIVVQVFFVCLICSCSFHKNSYFCVTIFYYDSTTTIIIFQSFVRP
jgi:uncharacterized membrane protein